MEAKFLNGPFNGTVHDAGDEPAKWMIHHYTPPLGSVHGTIHFHIQSEVRFAKYRRVDHPPLKLGAIPTSAPATEYVEPLCYIFESYE